MKNNKKNNVTKANDISLTQNNNKDITKSIHYQAASKEQRLILQKIATVGKLRAN